MAAAIPALFSPCISPVTHRTGTRIAIIELCGELGSGLAYETLADEHHINVPADRMGVGTEAADRFDVWLKERHPELIGDGDPSTPMSRGAVSVSSFATGSRMRCAIRMSACVMFRRGHCQRTRSKAAQKSDCSAASGVAARAKRHHRRQPRPAGAAAWHKAGLAGKRGLLENPWDIDRLAEIPPDGKVLIIGTGLTMADFIASLVARGHRGPILALSRHGLLARKAGPAGAPPASTSQPGQKLRSRNM